jgi:hypothetical protein
MRRSIVPPVLDFQVLLSVLALFLSVFAKSWEVSFVVVLYLLQYFQAGSSIGNIAPGISAKAKPKAKAAKKFH